jgi:AraC-like DNA-binding protein
MVPLVAPIACRALLDACGRLGLDASAILARVGLGWDALRDPEARVPAAVSDALWCEAYAAARDPHLALHAAEGVRFDAYRVLDYLGTTGPTLGDGLRRVAAYFRLIDPRGDLRVEESSGQVGLVFSAVDGAPLPQAAQEFTLAILVSRAREAAAQPWDPLGVRFTFPHPDDMSEYVRFFRVRPRFGADSAAVILSRDAWELPARAGDPELFALLDAHARLLLDRDPSGADLVAKVRLAIAVELPGVRPSLAAVARRIGTSRRSLQRSLEARKATFEELVDAVRRERAQAFLSAGDVSLAEVSWLLGFSEQSAFARAFKRWAGRSPTEHRRGQAGRFRGGARAP